MKNNVYSDTYNTYYQNNGAILFLYKSGRKNSKCEMISINHLISKEPDRKINDARIISYIIDIFEKCVYTCKKYNHIEARYMVDYFKQYTIIDANDDYYHGVEPLFFNVERQNISSIEGLLNYIFNMFCLVYPYNNIKLSSLHNDASIKYLINKYYRG